MPILSQGSVVSPSNDPPRRMGRGLYLPETNLGSGDGKPVQQIERKGVGEELTTCGGYPGRTRSHTLQFPALGLGVEHESIPD